MKINETNIIAILSHIIMLYLLIGIMKFPIISVLICYVFGFILPVILKYIFTFLKYLFKLIIFKKITPNTF